ncbi:MAG: 4Fe-4S dicluster domain-containing protein [Candidatus Omnitrophica bacterium]|nr:4Fe-4S dicluster domain-containing protein [Candidatus Omnitrophota bacterium]
MFGMGVVRGMMVTLRNFFTSYFHKPGEDGAIFTVEYPEKRLAEKERFRNFPFLIYDQTPDNLRCVACDICAKECPPKCIYIVREFDKDGKPLKKPAIFDIDFTVCMNCGICEEACPFDAIYMDHQFEIASTTDRQTKLLYDKEALLKSNEYFHKIRPTDAEAIDNRRREAEEKKKAAAEAAAKAAAERAKQAAQQPPPAQQQQPKPEEPKPPAQP